MPYKITTERLNDYNRVRINPVLEGQTLHLIRAELSADRKSIDLTDPKGDRFVLSTSYVPVPEKVGYDRIEMVLETHKPGIPDEDVEIFLERMLSHDQIFRRGQPFQDHLIPSQTLRREPPRGNTLVCSIIDRKASQERVEKAVYDYMTRPLIYYILRGVGNFSSKEPKQ